MAVVTVRCSQENCQNSFSHDDAMDQLDVELMADQNGWSKAENGAWNGCKNASACPLVHRPEVAAEPTAGPIQLLAAGVKG